MNKNAQFACFLHFAEESSPVHSIYNDPAKLSIYTLKTPVSFKYCLFSLLNNTT